MPPKSAKTKKGPRSRRTSSVGAINVGDTAIPNLTPKKGSPAQVVAKDDSSVTKVSKWLRNNVWFPPLVIMSVVWALYWFSDNHTESNPLHMFVNVSYEIPGTEPKLYGKGPKDFAFVGFYMLFFVFIREFLMIWLLRPMALYFGITKESKIKRFMEQTYAVIYYGVTGPWGLYIMKQMPLWYFNTAAFYENYPHKSHEHLFKVYYLAQAAFWAQQSVVLILRLEAPRKDFKELVFHHIVTIALIFLSYRFHFTWMGLAVYITMDVSDFFLGASKTLNYLDSPITGPFFVMFTLIWIYTRHYLNLKILWSVLTEFRTVGPYQLSFPDQQYKCWISQPIVFVLIFALQLLNAYWLFLIFRILYRYVFLNVAEDVRSDSESDEDDKKKDQ